MTNVALGKTNAGNVIPGSVPESPSRQRKGNPEQVGVDKRGKSPAPTLGGSIEHFRIGERVVTGEMVFDATRDCDGITLSLPFDLLTEISPAKFAMSIQQWREWMIESVIREMPKSVKKLLEAKRTAIDDEFFAALDNFPHKAPLLLLYEVLSNTKEIRSGANGASIDVPTVNPDKENHLRLHLVVSKPGFPEPYKIEVSPEWGSYRMFYAVRPAVVTFGIDFPLEDMRFGWRLGESALMMSDESRFWQAFRKRVEGAHPETEEKKQLIADRLNLLETGGVFVEERHHVSTENEVVGVYVGGVDDVAGFYLRLFDGLCVFHVRKIDIVESGGVANFYIRCIMEEKKTYREVMPGELPCEVPECDGVMGSVFCLWARHHRVFNNG